MSMKSYRGHNGDVFAVAIYKDKLISAGYDRIIRIYDLESKELLRKLAGHIDLIRTLDVYAADERRPLIVSGSWDRTIRVWELETGACLQIMTGHTNRLKCVVVCDLTIPGIILSGSDDTTMRAWEIESGHQIAEYNGHSHCVLSIAASHQQKPFAASGSTDCVICVWDLLSGRHLFNLKGHEAGVCALVFAKPPQDGSPPALISSSGDSTIRVWSMSSGEQSHIVKGHNFGIIALSIWQERTVPYPYLMTCAQNGTLQIWDLHSLELKKTTKTKSNYLISVAQKAGLDNVMAFCGAEGYIRVQRTEEIYNAADVIGAPASPTRRAERAPNRASPKRRNRSTKGSVSRSNSLESIGEAGSFASYSFNDDDSVQSPFNESSSSVFSPGPRGILMHIPDEEIVLKEVPTKQSASIAAPRPISDSLPETPRDEEGCLHRAASCDDPTSPATHDGASFDVANEEDDEVEEELTVSSFDARVIKSVVKEVVDKVPEPPSRVVSVEEEPYLACLQINNDMPAMECDDINSVMTEDDDKSVFENTESVNNGTQRFGRAPSNGRHHKRDDHKQSTGRFGGGSSVTSLDQSIQSSASVESIPRIPSAKWRHRGRHGPAKSITKGLGIGSRQSELRKVATSSRARGLPRIIEPTKPFILVTSIESTAYTALPAPVKPQQSTARTHKQPVIKHVKPPTIVSSPNSLPHLTPTSHNGYQSYNMDDTLKTIPGSVDSVTSDFLEVGAKAQSPASKKRTAAYNSKRNTSGGGGKADRLESSQQH